jgi:hypothetical protein
MSARRSRPVLLPLAYRYTLPADLSFLDRVPTEGTEAVRLRFSRGAGTTLEFPLSEDTLIDLIDELSKIAVELAYSP